jgi:hypothetical protein
VRDSNWGTSATTNSIAWALAQANGNLAADTVSIPPGLAINVDGATAALAWSRRLRRRIRNANAPERVENFD